MEASQEAPTHCTERRFNALGAVNRQPWNPERRGSGQVDSPEKLVRKPPSRGMSEPLGLASAPQSDMRSGHPGTNQWKRQRQGRNKAFFLNSEYLLRRAWAAGLHHRGGAPTTISPVSAMFLRRRRKHIADIGEIVVGAPPVFKEVGQHPSAGAHTGPPPHKEASQEAPKHCTGRSFNALGAVNRQPWNPERRGSGQVGSPEKLVRKPPSRGMSGPLGLASAPQSDIAEASPRGSLMPRDGGFLTNFSGLSTWPEPRLSGFHG